MSEWKSNLRQWVYDQAAELTRHSRLLLADSEAMTPSTMLAMQDAEQGAVFITADTAAQQDCYNRLGDVYQLLGERRPTHVVPESQTGPRRAWNPDNEVRRCTALYHAGVRSPHFFVVNPDALLMPLCDPQWFVQNTFTLQAGSREWPPEILAEKLIQVDYDNEQEVHLPGEFARRGGIIDIFSPVCDLPVRIEYFGDEIDSLRTFDPETQRSVKEAAEVTIVPRGTALTPEEASDPSTTCTLLDYLSSDTAVILWDPAALNERLSEQSASALVQKLCRFSTFRSLEPSSPRGSNSAAAFLECLNENWHRVSCEASGLSAMLSPGLVGLGENTGRWHWQLLREALKEWASRNYEVVACCGSAGEAQRFAEILAEDQTTRRVPISLEPAALTYGFMLARPGIVFLGEYELFGKGETRKRSAPTKPRSYQLEQRVDMGFELEEGSYAVHASYGVCRYRELTVVENSGQRQEVMELEFAEDARLYVPLDQAHLISRYVGGTKKLPRLSKLGGAGWQKKREQAASAAWDLAAEMLRTQAIREQSKGTAFPPDAQWEREFIDACPFTETSDQLQAIQDTLTELEDPEPMDRLVCGDSGYGKTEVAMRAAFRAVLNDKQVAVLVPTTVLAQQHYATFRERMSEFPVRIDMLSRFRTPGQQRQTLQELYEGKTDIVIATHRLLQNDISFADLGLLIIDEEQRFGVTHKEKLKQLRTQVNILTMTATPIPRTLYFSISGVRNLSRITTPPAERNPVVTNVVTHDSATIRNAIIYELERRGQAFFLHNRVQSIDKMATYLQELVPEARFLVAHGQMEPHRLEEIMTRFVRGEADVLVCTTIIESGLDIANANTIIIDRADWFGLADLYQLRGRVGRYNRQAYAYLLLPSVRVLPERARERLAAIQKFTNRGAGFKLAVRDLEIRGAGNLLGAEQSGHIEAVGFELYCELLKEAVQAMSQHDRLSMDVLEQGPELQLDGVVSALNAPEGQDGQIPAAIPPDYINAADVRVQTYRRLRRLKELQHVNALREEMRDRFGPPPRAVDTLLNTARIRVLAEQNDISRVTLAKGRVKIDPKDAANRKPTIFTLSASEPFTQLEELVDRLPKMADAPSLKQSQRPKQNKSS